MSNNYISFDNTGITQECSLDYQLSYDYDAYNHHYEEVTVTSSDENIVEIVSARRIKIKNKGTAMVTISSSNVTKTVKIIVNKRSDLLYEAIKQDEADKERERQYNEENEV